MESKTNYTIVGLIVILLIAGMILTLLWLSIGFDQKNHDIYAVVMDEAVSGLSLDAPVKFNGVKVGYVKAIRLNRKNPQQVVLLLSITHDTLITTSTTATLVAQGITGNTHVGLSASSSSLTPLLAQKGQPYPVIPTQPSLLHLIDNTLKRFADNFNAVSTEVKRIFNKQNAENLQATIQNIRLLSDTLEKDRRQIDSIIGHVDQTSKDWSKLSSQVHSGVRSLSEETIPRANTLLENLNQMAINLKQTSRDLKTNPSVLFRGKQPPKAGPGE